MMSNPQMMQNVQQMMSNPAMMQNMQQMMSGQMGQAGYGGMPGAGNPAPGVPSTGFLAPQQDPRERYQVELVQLMSMGFEDNEKNLAALIKYNGSVEMAATELSGGQ